MWQVLLGAAVAGSSILANKLLTSDNNQQISDERKEKDLSNGGHDGSVFMFSSIDHETEMGPQTHPRIKVGSFTKGFKGKIEGVKKKGSGKAQKRCGFVVGGGGHDGLLVDQRKKLGGAFLKKRRTSKCATGKCESCSTKESSLFNWGLGVGIMYMMSAGNGEISRLNSAMDETAKAVQELKNEFSRKQTFLNMHPSSSEVEGGCSTNNSRFNSVLNTELYNAHPYEEFGDACMKHNLTEEQPDLLEMDQLEADFVTEMEKLSYSTTEGSGSEGKPDSHKPSGFSAKDYNGNPGPYSGVSSTVLTQKLSHILVEQQENHIVELETELVKSNRKLNEKEAELQALKDCVRRLTQFSLASISDDENEEQVNNFTTMIAEPKKQVIGARRMNTNRKVFIVKYSL